MINNFRKSLTLSFFELKLKNQRTYLGFLWYMLQPAFMFFVLFYVKNNLLNLNIENFVPYLLIGVLMIHFFISSTNMMTTAITSNYHFFESRKIDPEIFIMSRFLTSVWVHLFEALMAVIILSLFGYWFSIFYFGAFLLFAIFTFFIGKILCVISTKFFDLAYAWNYFCQILWFITPVYFVAKNENFLISANPLNYFIDLARIFSYGYESGRGSVLFISVSLCLVAIFISSLYFSKNKKYLTERIK